MTVSQLIYWLASYPPDMLIRLEVFGHTSVAKSVTPTDYIEQNCSPSEGREFVLISSETKLPAAAAETMQPKEPRK